MAEQFSSQTTPKSDASGPLLASVSPNSVSDQPTRTDSLGFRPYVEAVAAFLTHPETQPPLTLSVEGAWGSGKSSFMLQLEDRIKAKDGKTVWFNAWRHDQEDELWAAFALDFTNKLAADFPLWKKWLLHSKLSFLRFEWKLGWFRLAKFVLLGIIFLFVSLKTGQYLLGYDSPLPALLSWLRSGLTNGEAHPTSLKLEELPLRLLFGVGGAAAYLLIGFTLIRKIADIVGNPLEIHLTDYINDPKYETHRAFLETFHSDFELLIRTYAEGRRVFVFVDDLDRCEVPKAAELMQAINLLISESAPVFYILGLDREKIAAGLAAKYEKLLPYLSGNNEEPTSIGTAGIDFGYNFLEKFIQIPFLLPHPCDSDVDKLLDSLSKASGAPATAVGFETDIDAGIDAGLLVELSTDSASVREVVKMVAPSFDYNPRRVKQFVNLFRLRALLASQTGLFGKAQVSDSFNPMTFPQLGKLVAIALRWPMLFTDVEKRPGLLSRLQARAWNEGDSQETSQDPIERYWLGKGNLMKLIGFPKGDRRGRESNQTGGDEYSLAHIDIGRFLQVAPSVPGRGLVENEYENSNPYKIGNLPTEGGAADYIDKNRDYNERASKRHPDSVAR